MSNFRIIPVIDILNGIAVHANKGMRNKYEPIKSILTNSSSAIELTRVYAEKLSISHIYIADLDSIIHENPNLSILEDIVKTSKIEIILDAGIRNLYDILQFKKIGIEKIILATETIDSINVIEDAAREFGQDKIIISIDMKDKKLLARSSSLKEYSIISLIEKIQQLGIKEIILLDLLKIGSKNGYYDDYYGEIRKKFPEMKIIVGGGIKDLEDLKFLKEKGMDGVLIATALHEGIITPESIKEI